MKTFVIIFCIAVGIFVLTLPVYLRVHRNMRRYWDRACTGFQWRRRFPDASKSEIRSFLALFVDSFAFHQKRRLCFSPDDKVMDVYRALYPGRFMADALELETLELQLRKQYGKDAASFWREDITLGEIFAHIRVA
jgi:hypothetical protein